MRTDAYADRDERDGWRGFALRSRSSRFLMILLLAVSVGFCSRSALAQTWTGATSGLWNGANWSSDPFLPISGPNTALVFSAPGIGGTTLTQNLGNPFVLNSIRFNPSAP